MRTQDAKLIPIAELLTALGHAPVKETNGEKWYLSPFRDEKTASFKLSADSRAFFDHGLGKGGNIIEFALLYFRVSLPEALREIERAVGAPAKRAAAAGGQYSLLPEAAPMDGLPPSPPPLPETDKRASGFTEVKIQPVTDERLLRYLKDRGIAPMIARDYLQEIRYTYQDKRYFALAFANDGGGMETRNQYFKGVFGKKAITTLHTSGESVPSIALFEGVFDFLSALVWDASAIDGAVIVMNSVAMKAQTLEALRRIGAPVVKLYLDHDTAGQTLADELRDELHGVEVLDCSGVYTGCKDFNEFLQRQQRQQGKQKGGILV